MLSEQPFPDSDATVQFQGPLPAPEAKTGLLVRNLDPKITESQLYDLFATFGPLHSCTVSVRAKSEVCATLQFFIQDHAQTALQEMHCSDIDGNLISVSICDISSKRSSKQSNGSGNSAGKESAKPRTPLNISAAPFNPVSGWGPSMHESSDPFDPIPTAQHMSTPLQQQFVDYTNLYIKNLDESVTSTDLFHHFKSYGRIISARVIVNAQTNQSRGYGFVSYSRPDEAVYALNQMNGVTVASKPIIVAFHEPKKPRVLPLSPKSPSESSSPIPDLLSDSSVHDKGDLYQDIYNSIASSGLVWDNNVQQLADVLAQLPRQEQASLLTQPLKMIEKIKEIRDSLALSPVIEIPKSRPINIRSPSLLSADSKEDSAPAVPISGSEVSSPTSSSTPQTIPLASPVLSASSQELPATGGPPEGIVQRLRRSGTSTSESTMSDQRDKLTTAVNQIDPSAGDDCIDMLMTLSAKDRSTCIFNPEYLRTKLKQARDALDLFADEDGQPSMPSNFPSKAQNGKDNGSAEQFYKTIAHLSSYEQKQNLGDRLFPLVKATGVKQAPKVTIRLLDTIDLPWLSQIMTPDNPELKRLAKSAFENL
ncbi:hypothetical protein INT43_007039 [Umbelopsis isabellina]|uniref:RRM domain-containing protein n=1 Tax=Mortierella isabellina TaxID=91625 RepID=A0A8H7PXC9_MORIS|nr:hypothetical protein INT43_007039 [Umbelopsis isabellina]